MAATDISHPDSYETLDKGFDRGTHRTMAPAETFQRVSKFMQTMGITRVADVTGLDSLGVPVAMAYRPNARSLSVSPGKGLDLLAAKTSALMESTETWHAERIHDPLVLASVNELRYQRNLIDVAALPRRSGADFHANLRLLWIEGRDVVSDRSTWVPFELVHLNFTLPLPTGSGALLSSSNGLASGNHVLEAMSHGLCEVVERDALALWKARSLADRAARKVEVSSVDDPACASVLARFAEGGCVTGIWDLTTDLGVPTFRAAIVDSAPSFGRNYLPGFGSGTHPVPEIALLRALTEAAQTRLTMISGARDDIGVGQYDQSKSEETHQELLRELGAPARRSFREIEGHRAGSLNADVAWQIDRLKNAGLNQVVALNLTRPEIGVPVVRVVVPGLESVPEAAGFIPGARFRKLHAESQS